MVKKVLLTVAGLFIAAGVQARLNIVTTTSDLASIASAVGGDYVNVTGLQSGKRDPHFLQAKPSYIMKAKNADLWICIGMELEIGYEPVILEKARNSRILPGQPGYLDASETVLVLEKPDGKIDRSMGDVHTMGNPHYWLDPYNGRQIALAISRRLKKMDPRHAGYYDEQAGAFCERLARAYFGEQLLLICPENECWELEIKGELQSYLKARQISLGGWKAQLLPFEGTAVTTYHKSWIYFLKRFGLTTAIELEPKPGIPPSPAHLAKVITLMKTNKVPLILMEPYYIKSHAEKVIKATGAELVIVANASGGGKEAGGYIAMLDQVVRRVGSALAGAGK